MTVEASPSTLMPNRPFTTVSRGTLTEPMAVEASTEASRDASNNGSAKALMRLPHIATK